MDTFPEYNSEMTDDEVREAYEAIAVTWAEAKRDGNDPVRESAVTELERFHASGRFSRISWAAMRDRVRERLES